MSELTLEKERVVSRLAALEQAQRDSQVALAHVAEDINALLHKHDSTLYGNGREGLTVRTDRLEQVAKQSEWLQKAMWVAVITVVVSQVGQFVMRSVRP